MSTAHTTDRPPRLGALLHDTAASRLGVLMDVLGGAYWLRPASGGLEWEARPCDVRPADDRRAPEEATA
jgi:hypothetical protein